MRKVNIQNDNRIIFSAKHHPVTIDYDNRQKKEDGQVQKTEDDAKPKIEIRAGGFNKEMKIKSEAKLPSQNKVAVPIKEQKIDLQNNNLFKIHFDNKFPEPKSSNTPKVGGFKKDDPTPSKQHNLKDNNPGKPPIGFNPPKDHSK